MQKTRTARDALEPKRAIATLRRLAGPIWQRAGVSAVLEVPRRRTGTMQRVSLIVVKLEGKLYVLAFGGVTDWALNLRTAGRATLRRRGRGTTVDAIEVDGTERDRVIAAYLRGSGPIKNDFHRRPDPAAHPTFRLEPFAEPG